RSPEPRRALQAAVLVENDTIGDQGCPGQEVREALRLFAIFSEIEHHFTSRSKMGRIAHVAPHHFDEQRVALGGPDRGHVAKRPQPKPGDPEPKPQPDGGRHRAVEDRDRARRSGKQDRFSERPVNWRFKPCYRFLPDSLCHQISAPPPNEKKDRKNEEAAKAI